jgi:CRISPR-associated protein Csm1
MSSYNILIKADFSGIQNFVFRIKSEKAAKTLKARSWFVQVLAIFAYRLVQDAFPMSELLYNGGGSFYLLLEKTSDFDKKLVELRRKINQNLWYEDIQLAISFVHFAPEELQNNFAFIWRDIQLASSTAKLTQFNGFFEQFEKTYKHDDGAKCDWPGLLRELLKTGTPTIKSSELEDSIGSRENWANSDGVNWFGFEHRFMGKGENYIGLPVWTDTLLKKWLPLIESEGEKDDEENLDELKKDNLIAFNRLARFAAERTGTEKIGILKLDVDRLGEAFNKMDSKEKAREFSLLMHDFFEKKLIEDFVGKGTFKTSAQFDIKGQPTVNLDGIEVPFRENIYVIYSGGDDTFLLGAWDAVFEFAIQFHEHWQNFVKTKLPKNQQDLTVSAALLVVDSNFPVIRFAELAEKMLDKAKSFTHKNHICVFGENQPMQWDDFKEAHERAHFLRNLILFDDEPRAVLERFRRATERFRSAMQRIYDDNDELPPIWNLFYAIRQSTHRAKMESQLVQIYSADVLNSLKNRSRHRETVPVAVRWAELLTRIESFNNRSEYV